MAKNKPAKRTYKRGGAAVAFELEAELHDAAAEAAAWANVSGLATASLSFWNNFIGLQSGTSPLDPGGIARLSCIVRAVSWVESQHGTGAGTSAAVDPMQCGNPGDSWWKELTDCSSPQDRFVGGTGKPNYNACELPDKAAADPSFPTQAYLSALGDETKGHNDGNFSQTMSYSWGVPFLIHKMNTEAGDPTYQCGTLERSRVVAGAVAYNGGGDPTYEAKINSALDMIGCLNTGEMSDTVLPSAPAGDPQTVIDFCEQEYSGNNDDCNKFLEAVSGDLNITLFQPGDNTDAIIQRLRDATATGAWTKLIDGPDGKSKADAGRFVIAGLKGADHNPPRAHGHVAVVVSGPLAFGKYPTGYWGSLDGTPGRNQTLNYAWNTRDRDNVEYYATTLARRTELPTLETTSTQTANEAVVSIMQELVRHLEKGDDPGKGSKFFPNGIELIDLSVQVGTVKIELKVAGPKSAS